jgi:hypothetical protein
MSTAETLLPIDMPPSSAGAPLPHVFADEGRLLVAYIANAPDPSFDGTNPRSISPATGNQSIAILTADPYLAFQFGQPNDEAISGHRLYAVGLQPYELSKSTTRLGSRPWRRQIGFIRPTVLNYFQTIGISS